MDAARIEVRTLDSGAGFGLTTRRNRSMPPQSLVWLLVFTACLSYAPGQSLLAAALAGGLMGYRDGISR